jgi:hypothetical protein
VEKVQGARKTMPEKSPFEIDCHDIIPGCGYQCDECISEMENTFKQIKGVTDFYIEKEGKQQLVAIEHDPKEASIAQLLETFTQLPSRHKGFFKPRLFKG